MRGHGHPNDLLHINKAKKENKHVLKTIQKKARHGIDKMHAQISLGTRTKEEHATNADKKKYRKAVMRSKSNPERGNWDDGECKKDVEDSNNQQQEYETGALSKAFEMNKDRPLPALPPKTNITDDDKLYDQVEDDEDIVRRMIKVFEKKNPHSIPGTGVSDRNRMGRESQPKEDFYSYSVEELVECFKICNLDRFAEKCDANKLDGAFFRQLDLNLLKLEPFYLNTFEQFKVREIIEGWRPKSGKSQSS
ncbi:uncharacterized protein LOC128555636 isoform X2 [Mercenaria mercenaria]|nr:uncharacterized protein LOC128555636 isoform X2 [Mercenaria mercenaria]